MGVTAENLAMQYNITREDSDRFALRSQQVEAEQPWLMFPRLLSPYRPAVPRNLP
jgi:acetyl-CoA acetyltransferase